MFFRSWGVPMSGASFSSFQLLFPSFMSDNDRLLICILVSSKEEVPALR